MDRDAAARVVSRGARDPSGIERDRLEQALAEIRRLEAELHRRVGDFQTLINVIPVGIALAEDAGCRVVRANAAFASALGLPPGGNASMSVPEPERQASFRMYRSGVEVPPADQPMERAAREGVYTLGEEYEIETADARRATLLPFVAPLFDEAGCLRGAVGAFLDITDRKRAHELEAMLAAIVQSSDDAIVGLALDGTIVSWNKGAETIFGYTAAEIVGRPVSVLAAPDQPDEIWRLLGTVRGGERLEHFETHRRRKDGSVIDVSLTISPILGPGGRIIGISKIARDITQVRRAAAELLKAKQDAEAASAAKDNFLAILSHELRTPLAPVLVKVNTLERSPAFPERMRADLAMIRRNIELEARLIDDLLDLTRISRGKQQLHRQAVDIRQVVHDALQASWGTASRSKHLQLVVDFGASDHVVWADSARLTQVFWNLLNNAIKFTPEHGRVTVRSRSADVASGEGGEGGRELVVEVADSGIGLAPGAGERIFDAFDQGTPKVTREFGGLGLGLAISRGIVELHGGRVAAFSEGPGQGAVFTVRLPQPREPLSVAAKAGAEQEARPGERLSTGLHILLVEDHADTADAMSTLLGGMGYRVTVAESVAAALAAAEESGGRDKPGGIDLVISDLDLPDGSGLDLMRDLRSRYGARGIALSGFGMDEDIRRSGAAGFERHLTKPVDLDSLEQAIEDLLA